MRYPRGIPAGLVAIAFGMLVAWGSALIGMPIGGMSLGGVSAAFRTSASPCRFRRSTISSRGFEYLGVILVTAIPFGIYDLVEAMDNVESAEAAGDHYPTTRVLTADGVVALIGCLMGNPFINAVYIGHPGWKSMGGRIGYSFATGVMVIVLCWFGVIAVLLALVPVVAISPILLYIGMLIGAQAFQTTPTKHAPAIIVALLPNVAAWGLTLINGALGAAGVPVTPELIHSMAGGGVLYEGLQILGDGAILTGLVLGVGHGLHHRAPVRQGRGLRPRRGGADLLRLHARSGARGERVAGGGARLRSWSRPSCSHARASPRSSPPTTRWRRIRRTVARCSPPSRGRAPWPNTTAISTQRRRSWTSGSPTPGGPESAGTSRLAAGMAALLEAVDLDDGALDLAPVYLPPDLDRGKPK